MADFTAADSTDDVPGVPIEDPFAPARLALERGDYGRVLTVLEPLQASHPPSSEQGAQLQLMLATACMGRGDNARAIACCRQVKRCADPSLRAQARDLLAVLEAPALQRPREWSLTLPELGETEAIEEPLRQLVRRRPSRRGPPPPPPPPVGPTRAPVGFAVLALGLLLLSLLLGGCVRIEAELRFGAPGRLQLTEQLSPPAGQPSSPWQARFVAALREQGLRPLGAAHRTTQRLQGPSLPAERTLTLLGASVTTAGRLADLPLPEPVLEWQERNWLVGVRQSLRLEFDLRSADAMPGLTADLDLTPLRARAVRLASPEPVQTIQPAPTLRWPIRLGALNQLELSCWRWSRLGLGALAIAAALALVLMLTALRRRLGFGWPELPA
jgi:hypothetical protein